MYIVIVHSNDSIKKYGNCSGVTTKVSSSDKGRKMHVKFTIRNSYKNNFI